MKIAFIGSGRQGGALGLQFAKAGHEVMFSSRHPETLKDLVAKAGAKARAREFDTGTPVYVKGLTARQLREALELPNQ